MVSTDLLFEPFRLKGLSLPNRVVMAPMTRSRSPGRCPMAMLPPITAAAPKAAWG